MTNRFAISALLVCGLTAAGCGSSPPADEAAAAASGGASEVRRATAWLVPTVDNEAHGSAIFIREGDQITVQVTLEDAPPGVHAVHLHQNGDCSADDASSAGGHWNPGGGDHGSWGTEPFHLGDVGNVTVGDDGTGGLTLTTDLWNLGGGAENDPLGKAVIVHAGADDFETQPTGGAGGRIACGVINPKK